MIDINKKQERDNKFVDSWKVTRQKGMLLQVAIKGGTFGLIMFVLNTFVTHRTTNFDLIALNFFSYVLVGGAIFGLLSWHFAERKYAKIVGNQNVELISLKQSVTFEKLLSLRTKEACEKAINLAIVFSLISAILAFLFAFASFFTTSNSAQVANLLSPYTFFDTALTLILTYYIYKKSRIAIVTQLLILLVSKLMEISEFGITTTSMSSLIVAFVFILIYANGARAIFKWHSVYKA